MIRSTTLRGALFAAGILGALGFGGAQAFAAPAAPADDAFCSSEVCLATCLAKGYHGGYCVYNRGCQCYRIDE